MCLSKKILHQYFVVFCPDWAASSLKTFYMLLLRFPVGSDIHLNRRKIVTAGQFVRALRNFYLGWESGLIPYFSSKKLIKLHAFSPVHISPPVLLFV